MKTVLVIDDETLILKTIAAYLDTELHVCRILTASNGLEGERVLEACQVDLIITDLGMPVMDGATFITRTAPLYPEIPIFVMTGKDPADHEEQLAALGVRRIFEKPFRFGELTREISRELQLPVTVDVSELAGVRR